MRAIPKEQVLRRMHSENPWWDAANKIPEQYLRMRPRAYFSRFHEIIGRTDVKRAVLLMGPRRVGKTVLIHHVVQRLLDSGVSPNSICYISVDHPLYNGCELEDLLAFYDEAAGVSHRTEQCFVFFDEIQYLKDWEIYLKHLIDSGVPSRFVASGSAAAALKMKSHESGAGRFTDFLLPPLTFSEYLDLLGLEEDLIAQTEGHGPRARDIEELNSRFIQYLNFGGYPEVALSEAIQQDPGRFIKSDIIDKVLLRDLPGLYGIQDIQELNYLFTTLAYNTAQEVSLEQLSQGSGVAKNTIKRYIEYLEAAFLLKVVHRIDRNGKRFQRANFFKVYLTNPSIRTALFSPVSESDDAMGALAETAAYSQWFHIPFDLYYARWNDGEVDIVGLDKKRKPMWAVEVKWSDRFVEHPRELKSLWSFCKTTKIANVFVTTRTLSAEYDLDGLHLKFVPASLYCYTLAKNVLRQATKPAKISVESQLSSLDE